MPMLRGFIAEQYLNKFITNGVSTTINQWAQLYVLHAFDPKVCSSGLAVTFDGKMIRGEERPGTRKSFQRFYSGQ